MRNHHNPPRKTALHPGIGPLPLSLGPAKEPDPQAEASQHGALRLAVKDGQRSGGWGTPGVPPLGTLPDCHPVQVSSTQLPRVLSIPMPPLWKSKA